IMGALSLTCGEMVGQSTTPGNVAGGVGDFLGWDNTFPANNFPLRVRHDLNQPIEFYTDAIQRMRLSPNVTSSMGPANQFPNVNKDGYLLLSGQPDAFTNGGSRAPFTRLHLIDGVGSVSPLTYAQEHGFRPWQRNGITFTGNSDQSYIGHRYAGNDNTDFVIQWSDNPDSSPWGTDRLKILFTTEYSSSSTKGATSMEGLEAIRLWPKNNQEVNMGVGNFAPAAVGDPTERVDVLDGRVRIRQLPTDPEANTLDKYMVVDNAGVVKWRYLPPSSTTTCDWELNTANNYLSTAWRPIGTNGSCPDQSWKVGIGNSSPQFKLEVIDVEAGSNSTNGGLRVDLRTDHSGWRYGVKSYLEPKVGGANLDFGASVLGDIANVGLAAPGVADGYGVYGRSKTDQALYVRGSIGVMGYSTNTAGTITQMLGGDFYGNNAGGVATATYGVRGRATSSSSTTVCYGVYGQATGTDDPGGPNGHTKWAGYFPGYTYVGGTTFGPSDAQLKQNIEDLEPGEVATLLQQLAPKSYVFNQEQFGFMQLPIEHQYGLIAQEVEAVLPELVTEIHQPAMLDSTGMMASPAIDFKSLNYQGFIPLLIAGFQYQQQMLDQQQATIAQLQQQVAQCCASDQGMAPQGYKVEPDDPAGDLQEQRLLIIPNPVADITTLEYYVPQAGRVSLSVSTSDGKPLGTLREEQAEPGAYSYPWNTTKLAAGTYFCTYLLDGQVVVKRAVKVWR
ncbi:MAG: tail fiber domain-containing protein, partial [Flavobacteriales bacterium]|nr:tail fiber domain-containing protein [Flavobacteriales bacterium]